MTVRKGDSVKIKKDGQIICAGITQKDINFNADLIDTTAGSNRGRRRFMKVIDVSSLDLSFKGFSKARILRKMRLGDNNFFPGILVEFGNGDTVTGDFMMAGYSESGAFKDAIQFSCEFQSSGKSEYTFAAGENDDGSPSGNPVYPPAESGLLDGVLKLIGRNLSTGLYNQEFEDISTAGDKIPAVAPLYNFETASIEAIYQRPRIFKNNIQLDNFAICAITGGYAISCELNYSEARYVAITRYRKDSGDLELGYGPVLGRDEWMYSDYVEDEYSVNFIDCGENFSPTDIVMIEKNKFLIVATPKDYSYETGPTTTRIMLVTFVDTMQWTMSEAVIDLADIGIEGAFVNPGEFDRPMRVAFDVTTPNKITISYLYANAEGWHNFTIFYYQDTDSFVKANDFSNPLYAVFADEGSISEQYFYLDQTSYFYRYATGSFGNRLIEPYSSYGYHFVYTTYASRNVLGEDSEPLSYVVYVDAVTPETEVIAPQVISPKLTTLGMPSTNPDYSPKFGAASLLMT